VLFAETLIGKHEKTTKSFFFGMEEHQKKQESSLNSCFLVPEAHLQQLFAVVLARYCERLATLSAACRKNATAIGGLHAQTETVLVHSLAVVGLECPFHLFILFLLLIFRS
jgi:hypothetical protein